MKASLSRALLDDIAVGVKPCKARSVAGIELELVRHRARMQEAGDSFAKVIDPLAGQRRYGHHGFSS